MLHPSTTATLSKDSAPPRYIQQYARKPWEAFPIPILLRACFASIHDRRVYGVVLLSKA
ncbi:hypothetical protein LTS18_000424, partial [Coniosporium uncinatum]